MLLDTKDQLSKSDKEFLDSQLLKSTNAKDTILHIETANDGYSLGEWYDPKTNGKGVSDMTDQKTYDADNIPSDAEVSTGQPKEFAPIDASETYTVEILKANLQDNFYYRPDAPTDAEKGNKYVIGFEFAILDDGEYYGRRLWASTSLALKPTTKRGTPTILYKIVSSALKSELSWSDCGAFAPDTKGLLTHLKDDVIGKQIKVAIENTTNPSTKKVRSKITSYNPIKKELPKFDAEKAKAIGEARKSVVEVGDTTIPF